MKDKIVYPLHTRLNVLIGRQLEEAVRLIESESLVWRIVSFDRHERKVERTPEVQDRVNLEVHAGKVVEAIVY